MSGADPGRVRYVLARFTRYVSIIRFAVPLDPSSITSSEFATQCRSKRLQLTAVDVNRFIVRRGHIDESVVENHVYHLHPGRSRRVNRIRCAEDRFHRCSERSTSGRDHGPSSVPVPTVSIDIASAFGSLGTERESIDRPSDRSAGKRARERGRRSRRPLRGDVPFALGSAPRGSGNRRRTRPARRSRDVIVSASGWSIRRARPLCLL